MKRRRVDPLLLVGAVLLLAVIAVTVAAPRADEAGHGLTASVYDEGPGGAATLRRLIEAVGLRTVTLEGDRFDPAVGSARVLFMLRPSELVTAPEVTVIRSYLVAGGIVVVADDFEPSLVPLLEAFDVRLAEPATTVDTRLAGALFAATGAREVATGGGRELRLGSGWDAIGTDGRGPTIAMRTVGKGTLIVAGTVTPFITAELDQADNARFAVALAAATGTAGVVAFDEFHHGVHPPPTIFAVVERTWPGRALLFALAAVFAYIVLTGRRLGRPRPLDPRPPRSSLEYVRGFAGLVRRAGRQEIVRDRARRELHAGLARRHGLDPATPFTDIVERLRSGSGSRADEAAALDAQLRRRLREPELVRTVARVATLLHEEAP